IYCYDLTSVTIPETVTNIGKNAFYSCNSLTQVNISDIASWSNISFGDALSNPLYYAKNLYLNGELVTDLIIPEGVRKINDFAFYNCTPLTSVIIPDGVTSIGNSAFEGCSALTKVRIPDNVTSIGNKTFYNCYSLKNVTIPDGVTSIGDMPFSGCSSLTSVIIPDSVTSVGIFNFNGCTSLTSIVIPDSVTSIPDAAFKNCTSLTSVTIPGGVTNICDEAFDECSSLRYVFFAGSSEDWDKIIKGVYNTKLYSVKIHYNATDHSHSVVKNLPSSEGMEGSIEDICPVCGFVNSSEILVYVNNYITAVDTKNVVIDASAATLTLDISASKDLSEAIVVMDGYTLKVIPNSDYGFLGTGSKVQIIDSTGNVVAEYTLVVRGDVNGDSVCDVLDCMLIELVQTHNTTLDGVYLAAGDLTENGEISIEDFSAVVNKALNKA
ncbi:MAG: leucine-rich repeat protein, partial [Clostridia bacterium]|nr:leucine-rich repeat protein [Clostridia bacterium]